VQRQQIIQKQKLGIDNATWNKLSSKAYIKVTLSAHYVKLFA